MSKINKYNNHGDEENGQIDLSLIAIIKKELQKIEELDKKIDDLERDIENYHINSDADIKDMMKWFELLNNRRKQSTSFITTFYQLASKNEFMKKLMNKLTVSNVKDNTLPIIEEENTTEVKEMRVVLKALMSNKINGVLDEN